MRVLLVRLGEAQSAVIRFALEARDHTVAVRQGDDPAGSLWHEETYDLVVDRWPRPGRSGFTSWAASTSGAFILTVVDGQPDHELCAKLLAAGSDDVIEESSLERHLYDRILVAETAVLRRLARRKEEAITHSDMTAQLAEQEGLRDLAENMTTTLTCIGDAVISCDAAAAVTWMNPVAEKLTESNVKDARNRPLHEIFKILDSETRAVVENPVARVLRHGGPPAPGTHWVLVRGDGSELRIADSCALLKGADNLVRGAVLVFRDVSAEHRASELQERTRRALFLAERMASIGTLAAGAAHEINNPLGYLISNLDITLEDIRASRESAVAVRLDELEEMIREARGGAERVRHIVQGLKTFSRNDEERRVVSELKPIVELAVAMTANEVRHRARLVMAFGPVPLVEADATHLGQVFINLLVNAAQALPDGQREANEIRITTSTDAAGQAIIAIKDTGPGIAANIFDRLFDPFFTTKAVGHGTGLGLSISQNIIRAMGGEIGVESDRSHGTTFRIVLPPAAIQELPRLVESSPPLATRRARVLVVDDEAALGKVFHRILQEHDLTVVTRARDALDRLALGETFDVIFSDLMMPEMSGMDFFEEAARRFPTAAERMVFITGGAFTPDAIAFLAGTRNKKLEKPFDPETVRALVGMFSRRRSTPAVSGVVELRPKEDASALTGTGEGRPAPGARR